MLSSAARGNKHACLHANMLTNTIHAKLAEVPACCMHAINYPGDAGAIHGQRHTSHGKAPAPRALHDLWGAACVGHRTCMTFTWQGMSDAWGMCTRYQPFCRVHPTPQTAILPPNARLQLLTNHACNRALIGTQHPCITSQLSYMPRF